MNAQPDDADNALHAPPPVGARLTTPRSAAVAGILFAVLLTTSYVLLRLSVPAEIGDSSAWLDQNTGRVKVALWLIPFAGIAFLWFIGVIRDRLGDIEDRFFSSVLFGSGLLFLAMTFVSAALAGALIVAFEADPQVAVDSELYLFARATMFRISNVFGIRMAAVFMMSVGTIWFRSKTMPRWLVVVTYALAVVQLVAVSLSLWLAIVFPAWVLLVSVYFLVARPPGVHPAAT